MIGRNLNHALALLENGWSVRLVGGRVQWTSPRGISGSDYTSIDLNNPPRAALSDAAAHHDYHVSA